jgi:hypothetical protein
VMVNGWWEDLTFTVQESAANGWRRVADTGQPSPDDICEAGQEVPLADARYRVSARSVVVLIG